MSLNIIKDYAPNLLNLEESSTESELDELNDQLSFSEESEKLLSKNEESMNIPDFYNPLDYFDEITSLSKLNVRQELKKYAIPVPMDFFRRDPLHKLRQVLTKSEEILSSKIAEEYNLEQKDLAVNEENYPEVEKYLFNSNPTKITQNSINCGVIGAGYNFLVMVGCPNKQGYPGRLFILYSRCDKRDRCRETDYESSIQTESCKYIEPIQNLVAPTPLNMESGFLRDNYKPKKEYKSKKHPPMEYQKTMHDISNYDKSLVGQTLESIDGLREIFSNFFIAPVFERHNHKNVDYSQHQRPIGKVYDI